MTTSEQAAILDEQLRRGYETFDGFILGERERAASGSNAGTAHAGLAKYRDIPAARGHS
jgi:hypothetical protein